MRVKKTKILFRLAGGIFVLLLLVTPAVAYALPCYIHPAGLSNCVKDAVGDAAGGFAAEATKWLIGIFNELLSKVVAFFAFVLNWTFDIQEITSIDVIQFAWSVSRDFANMFFILILLIIAFATILRYEPYGIKRLLPKLLLVALLINFSMVGAGLIIDLGSSLGHFFVTGGAYNESAGDIGANIAAAVGIQSLNNYEGSKFALTDAASTVVDALFSLVLTAIIAFLFMIMAGLMLVRLVALWMLVIFVPLALVAWVVPAGQKYWRMWWEKFFAWAFFPAIFGIFIYFALIIGNAFQTSIFTELGSATVEDSSWFTVSVQSFLQMLIVVFILTAGLKYARTSGLEGAGLAVKWGDKARNAALGYTKSGAKYAARPAVRGAKKGLRAAAYGKDEQGQRTKMRSGLKTFSRIPGVGIAGSKLAEQAAKIGPKDIADADKNLGDIATNVPALQARFARAKGAERIAIAKKLAALGQLKAVEGLITEDEIAKVMQEAKVVGQAKELIRAKPVLALQHGVINERELHDVIGRIKPKDFENMGDGWLDEIKKYYEAEYTDPNTRNYDSQPFDVFMQGVISRWSNKSYQNMLDAGHFRNFRVVETQLKEAGAQDISNPDATLQQDWPTRRDLLNNVAPTFARWVETSGREIFDLGQPLPRSAAGGGGTSGRGAGGGGTGGAGSGAGSGAGGGQYPPGTVLNQQGQPIAGPGVQAGRQSHTVPPKPGTTTHTSGGTIYVDRRSSNI